VSDVLLVIDVVNSFRHEDGDSLLASFRSRLAGMSETLAQARARDLPVMYVNDAHGDWTGDAPAFVRRAIEAGEGGEVVQALAPLAHERFLFKPRYSAFDHTPLALILEGEQVDRVLIAGAATEGCIVQSAIDARELGLKATILERACATANQNLERVALAYAREVGGVYVSESLDDAVDHSSADGSFGSAGPTGPAADVVLSAS
jgi:nicotinamidase-related amidase